MKTIRIGTRGSKLALWQAEFVAEKLREAGMSSQIVPIETSGDKILEVTIAKIGSKGVFTEEIETELLEGNIDIAVHSAKDLQSELPDGFEIIAFSERETPNDVLVSHQPCKLENSPMVIGTSSTRRVAILKRSFPEVKTVPVRGNLQTRIRKMEEGACDALLLAYAGVHRMQREDLIREVLDPGLFIPAVGQGSVAIECASSLDESLKKKVKNAVNHPDTALCVEAERAFLRTLQGGCSIPAFALAHLEQNKVVIEGGIVSLDGQKMVKEKFSDNSSHHIALGVKLATVILDSGGDKILAEIRHSTE